MAIQAGGIEAHLRLNTGDFDRGLSQAQSQMSSLANNMKQRGKQIEGIGKSMTKGITLPLAGLTGLIVKSGMDFESSMSQVEAISGSTGAELKGLETLARDLAKATRYDASEAADGLTYMAMAGWDATQMTAGLPHVLNLATAGSMDLALASDIVTDALTAFGMGADDTEGFVDLLASTATNSNTDVSEMGEAFKFVAPIVGALGATADDTALALGLMANAGIKGGMAGRQLRMIVNRLVTPTEAGAAAMEKYNIELVKGEDGSVDLSASMGVLRKQLQGLDKDQQASAASAIFGTEAQAGALAIINASEEDYIKLTGATNEYVGAAQKMADIMDDNLEGSFEKLKSNLKEAGLQLAEVLIPMVEKGVEWVSKLVDKFTALDTEQREQIVKWGLVAMAAGPVLTLLGKGIGVVGGIAGGFTKLTGIIGGTAGATGVVGSLAALGPLGTAAIAAAGLGAVGLAAKKLYDRNQELKEVNLEVADSFVELHGDLSQNIGTFDRLSEKSGLTNEQLARMYELQGLIGSSDNQSQIEAYTRELEGLKKESGLTEDEIELLFQTNKALIEQSPQVETSINSQGEEFVTSTGKAKEYRDQIENISEALIDAELAKAEFNKEGIKSDTEGLKADKVDLIGRSDSLGDFITDPSKSTIDRQKEIRDLQQDSTLNMREQWMLYREMGVLRAIEKGDLDKAHRIYGKYIDLYADELKAIDEKIAQNDLELEQVDMLLERKADILLSNLEINEVGQEGLSILVERIANQKEELVALRERKEAGESLSVEDEKRLAYLTRSTLELEQGKLEIFETTGMYHTLNDLAQTKLNLADETTQKHIEELGILEGIEFKNGDILGALDEKTFKLDEQLESLRQQREAEGANTVEIDKQIEGIETKIGQQAITKMLVLEELGLWGEIDGEMQTAIINEANRGAMSAETKNELINQGFQIDNNNNITGIGIGLEKERSEEAGRDVDKTVKVTDNGKVEEINKESGKTVWKTIKMVAEKVGSWFGYADGTPPSGHPGGLALVGDGNGEELIINPDGGMFLSPPTDTYMNLRKGTHVLSHEDTKGFFRNLPRYAQGTQGSGNVLNNVRSNVRLEDVGSSQKVEHSGIIRVEGVNDYGQLVGVVEKEITNNISSDSRRLPDRPRLIPN